MSTSILAARQKKGRKAQQRSEPLRAAIAAIVAEYDVMTVRQLYYQLEMRGHIGKTEADYDRVQYHCLQMRRTGEIDHGKIRDSSRERRRAVHYHGLSQALNHMTTSTGATTGRPSRCTSKCGVRKTP